MPKPPHQWERQAPHFQTAIAKMCLYCLNDFNSDVSCSRCETSYDRLKERGELPRRREAILATRRKINV